MDTWFDRHQFDKHMPTREQKPKFRPTVSARTVLLASLLLALVAYLPGMSGSFVFDDYSSILENDDLHGETFTFADLLQAGWSGMAGPLKRPLAMMSFALNYATTGDFIAGFKFTNLIIHLANGVLLSVLLHLLLVAYDTSGRRALNWSMLAAVAAAIWLLHPINLTSVLYVVQRMNSLSAMFSLIAMICYCAGRRRLEIDRAGAWWLIGAGVPLFIALGMLCKENAVLTLPLIALIEACFFRLRTSARRDRTTLIAYFALTVFVPAIVAMTYLVANPDFLGGRFAGRPFTLAERLLTEARVLWFYLSLMLVPKLNQFGLYHDDFSLSTSLIDPISTAAAIGGIAFALALAVVSLKRWPMLTFAIGWYLIAHVLESSVIALELVHEHRNYIPSIGVVFALSYAVAVLFQQRIAVRLQQTVVALIIVLCASMTFLRAGDWSDPVTLAVVEAERHPNSLRAVYDLGRIQYGLYELSNDEGFYQNAILNLERAAMLDPDSTQPLAGLIKMAYQRGHSPKPEWMPELLRRYEHTLFHPSETEDLHRMVKCRAEQTCNIPADDIAQLYHAALANPTIPSYQKAQLMVDLAAFYINEVGDLEPAINLLDDAVALFPSEFGFRKVRAQVYLMAGRYQAVEDETQYMRSIAIWRDEINSPIDAIASLERGVAEAKERDVNEPEEPVVRRPPETE